MQLSWSLLLLLLVFSAFAVFWNDTLATRERANDAARETCASTGGALLDGTVVFRKLKVVRGLGGRLAFERTYVFDYTLDGDTRRQGFIVMFGRRVDSIGLD
ncbi:MAG: DUF3301 domain-containing protein [Steroidobacteraceae bacterium]